MKKAGYLILILISIPFIKCENMDIKSGQEDSFLKLYGYSSTDLGNDVKVFDKGFLLAATVIEEGENQSDIAIIKTNRFGIQDQIIVVGGDGNDEASKILLTNDGGFIVVGTYEDTVSKHTDIYLNKFDYNLTSEWETTIGNSSDDEGIAIASSADGFVIVGNTNEANGTNGNPAGRQDILMVKVDLSGGVLWTNSFGGSGDDMATDIISIVGGFMIIGTTDSFNEPIQAGSNIILIETNTVGSETDKLTYGGSFDDVGASVIKSGDGGYVITGTIQNVSGGNSDIYVAKIENNIHNIIWEKTYGSTGTDYKSNNIIKSESDFVVCGSKSPSNVAESAYFLKVDIEGEVLVENTFGGFDTQIFNSAISTSDGGFAMVGSSGFEGNHQICLLKVDYKGDL